MAKVLLVEDDLLLAENLVKWLTSERHSVDHASTYSAGRELALSYQYDVLILDWELPDGTGPSLCDELRRKVIKTPILMLTARGAVVDKIKGLDFGADDYVSKPCLPEELSARIRALLRRHESAIEVLHEGALQLNRTARSVRARGLVVQLSPGEFDTLEVLMRNNGTTLTAEAMVALSQSRGGSLSRSSIKVHVSHIKKKFAELGVESPIDTVSGGYQFSPLK